MRTPHRPTLISLAVGLILALGLVMPATAAHHDESTFAVYHGPVVVTLADTSSDGHQPGDLRATSVDTTDADGTALGRLEATLATTTVDVPSEGDESRIGTLVFSFGDAGQDQLVVQGSAYYAADGPTIADGDTTVRPIVGGSGKFIGAAGDAVTEHLEDDTWVHTFHLSDTKSAAPLQRKADRDLWKAERKAQRELRKADRTAGKDRDSTEDIYVAESVDETGVLRTDLGIAAPGSAPSQELGLWHYSIPAGQELAPHTHPGWQLARVTAGELEYSVISGEGQLLRADGDVESMGSGTYVLAAGDGVIENPDLVHFGANRGDELVTLISATLYPAGAPLSTLVDAPTSDTEDAETSSEPDMAEASPAA